MKKKIGIFLIFILSMQIFFVGCTSKAEKGGEEGRKKPVEISEVKEDTYTEEISMSGNIKPSKTVRLAYKIPGIIENIYVEEGQTVKKDQVLTALDTYDYELKALASNAKWESSKLKMESQIPSKINQAKAQLDVVAKTYERMKGLYEAGALSTSQMDEVEAKHIAAQNTYQEALDAKEYIRIELKQAEALRDSANSNLKDTKLGSPIDGIVLKKLAESGETIGKGYPVLVLGQMDEVETEIGIADAHINKIQQGQKAKVYVYGIEREFEGVISEVGALADTETRTFPVKITINNEEGLLRAGMVAKVTIPLNQTKTIMIPVDSIINMTDGTVVFVYSEEEGTVKKQNIVSGEIIKDQVQVKEGLKPGDKIVVKGQLKLKDCDKVRVGGSK